MLIYDRHGPIILLDSHLPSSIFSSLHNIIDDEETSCLKAVASTLRKFI